VSAMALVALSWVRGPAHQGPAVAVADGKVRAVPGPLPLIRW
jgi:hypothetical protein